jgi:hypothetical protein
VNREYLKPKTLLKIPTKLLLSGGYIRMETIIYGT